MDSKILERLRAKDPIPNDLLEEIKSKGFLTGSFVFGGYAPGISDIDIVIKDKDVNIQAFHFYFVYVDGYDNGEYQCFFVRNKNGEILNILVMDNEPFQEWKKATFTMKRIVEKSTELARRIAKEKKFRVRLFELLRFGE